VVLRADGKRPGHPRPTVPNCGLLLSLNAIPVSRGRRSGDRDYLLSRGVSSADRNHREEADETSSLRHRHRDRHCDYRRRDSRGPDCPAPAPSGPTVDQLIALKRAGSPAISPDGTLVAYTVREVNWDENAYETEIWIADVAAGTNRQLTNGKKSSGSPRWSPDGARIAFTSDRSDKQQIWLIRPSFGEAEQLTREDEGVGSFAWSPDGRQIAFTMTDPKPEAWKDRDKKYGEFEMVDEDQRVTHLWVVDVESKKTKRLTKGSFTVGSFDWSPDGRAIAFDHTINRTLRTAARPTFPSSQSRMRRSGRSSPRRARTTGRSGRRTGRRSRSRRRWRSLLLLHEQPHRGDSRGGRVDHGSDEDLRREPGPDRLAEGRHLLQRLAEDRRASLPSGSRDAGREEDHAVGGPDRLGRQPCRGPRCDRVHPHGPKEFPDVWVVSAMTGALKKVTDLGPRWRPGRSPRRR